MSFSLARAPIARQSMARPTCVMQRSGPGSLWTRCLRWMPSEEERAERRAIDAKLDAIARRLAEAQAQDEAYRVFSALRSHVDGLAEARMRCGHLRQSLSPVCSRSKGFVLDLQRSTAERAAHGAVTTFYRRQQNQMKMAAITMRRIATSKNHLFRFCHATTIRKIETRRRRILRRCNPCHAAASRALRLAGSADGVVRPPRTMSTDNAQRD